MKQRLIYSAVLLLTSSISFGQCDNTLKPADNPKLAYKDRGNRCEGAYSAKVGAPSIDLVAFTVGALSYKLEKTEVIEIENPFGFTIHIRSSALPLNTYYRMDATLEKSKTLKWEVKDALFDLQIPSNSLGIYGWMGTENEKTFLPVKVVSSTIDRSDQKLYLIIRPSARVLGVKYRYSLAGESFNKYEDIKASFRPGQAVIIILPDNLKGEYNIEIAAMLESKSDWIKNQYKLFIK